MPEFLQSLIPGLVVTSMAAIVGYTFRAIRYPELYLPKQLTKSKKSAYGFVKDCKHEYHFTRDTRHSREVRLAHGKIDLQIKANGLVEGAMAYDLPDRHSLSYSIRGEVSNGRLSYTAVCDDDPSDIYSTLFTTVLDPKIVGQMVGIDYQRVPYASPVVLSDEELDPEAVSSIIERHDLGLYGFSEGTMNDLEG